MGLRINTNVPALNMNRQATQASRALSRGFEGMASGLRITSARVDAAGLAIAEQFQSQVRQYDAESRNLQSGVNAAQTADGALQSQTVAVQRIRELAVQASNGTMSDENRAALNAEARELVSQIEQTAQNTEFNGTRLLASDQSIEMGVAGDMQLNTRASTDAALGISGLDLSTAAGASAALDQADSALNAIGQNRAAIGAQENRFSGAIENRQSAMVNTAAAESALRDYDMAYGAINQSRLDVLASASTAMLGQANLVSRNVSRLLGG
jgi:flagellin